MTGETATAKVLRTKGYSSRSHDEASSSPGRQQQQQAGGAGSQAMPRANTPSTRNNVVDEQQQQSFPPFRKPRLDVSVAGRESSSIIEEDGNSAGCNANKSGSNSDREASVTPGTGLETDVENDGSKVADSSGSLVGDCSTCGDVGFQTELFRCTKCLVRLQHRYCSNSYNPRKRWLIRLCNWCEAEGAAALPSPQPQITGGGSSRLSNNQVQQVSSKRDSSSSPWGCGAAVRSAERSNAVECLLGAALRLPGAGFSSVEDLLQVNDSSNVSSSSGSSKRKKPPSFDSVEKARRSGPGGDIRAVKLFKRPAPIERPVAAAAALVKGEPSPSGAVGGESQRSSSSSVDNGEQQQRRSPSSGDQIPSWKVKKSPTTTGAVRSLAAATAATAGTACPTTTTSLGGTMASAAAATRDAKTQGTTEPASTARQQRTDVNGGGRNVGPKEDSSNTRAGRASSCDSSERHEQSSTSTTTSTGEAGGASAGGEATVVDKEASTLRLSPSNSSRKMRVLSSKSPRSSPRPAATAERNNVRDSERAAAAVPEVSSSSQDNAAASRTTKRSNAAAHAAVDQCQKIRRVPSFKNDAKENSVGKKSMSVSRPRESSASDAVEAPLSKRPRTVESAEKTTPKSPTAIFNKSPSMRSAPGDGDEHSDNSKSSGGGSNCSNVTQEQRRQQQHQKHSKGGGIAGGKDLPRAFSSETKSAAVKHQPQQVTTGGSQKLARDRPTYSSNAVGKSGTHTSRISNNAEDRAQKKASNHKDSSGKLRRNSSKITGIHNYKSLSDILC